MNWANASLVFGNELFEDYSVFCIFISTIDDLVMCTDSESIVNKFACWIDGKADFPEIGNKLLANKLQSKYDKLYRASYINTIRESLDEFESCFDSKQRQRYWSTDISAVTMEDTSSDMFERLQRLGEGLVNAERFYN